MADGNKVQLKYNAYKDVVYAKDNHSEVKMEYTILGSLKSRKRGNRKTEFKYDKVKSILRKTRLFHENRLENDAEHSWTICMMALVLHEYADFDVDINKVIKMLLIHDIVEIDTGDTFLYDVKRSDVQLKENTAAERIFGMLDSEQKEYFALLWIEFEQKLTPEAKFASAVDRLEPILQNYINKGGSWKENNITYEMVIKNNKDIKSASTEIWDFVLRLCDAAVEKGYLERRNNN